MCTHVCGCVVICVSSVNIININIFAHDLLIFLSFFFFFYIHTRCHCRCYERALCAYFNCEFSSFFLIFIIKSACSFKVMWTCSVLIALALSLHNFTTHKKKYKEYQHHCQHRILVSTILLHFKGAQEEMKKKPLKLFNALHKIKVSLTLPSLLHFFFFFFIFFSL